jgi:NAD(P)-dependent dehydrogenase (short-subunit alcohol dehydrogenase family)
MTKMFENKVAMVTGGGSGIGAAMARRFAEEGATVVVADLDEKAAGKVASAIEKDGGTAVAVRQDVGDPESVEKSVDFAVQKFGRLDVAVNNAGITGDLSPTADYSLEGWDKVIAVNLSGVFYGMKYQIPAMLRLGGGSIVNIASILGSVGARFGGLQRGQAWRRRPHQDRRSRIFEGRRAGERNRPRLYRDAAAERARQRSP